MRPKTGQQRRIPANPGVDHAPGGELAGDYLDTYAKVNKAPDLSNLQQKNIAKWLYHNGHADKADRLSNCGQNWIAFSCKAGHNIYHRITCGLPFCPTCGKIGSPLNRKRSGRVKDIIIGFSMLGHYVFTLPKEISATRPTSDKINQLYRLAFKVLKEVLNAQAAVIALHFCGDNRSGLHLHFDCTYPILDRPHDCTYSKETLEKARAEWTSGVNKIFNTSLDNAVCHYNFANKPEQIHHLIHYTTRSTIPAERFLDLNDQEREYILKLNHGKVIRYFGGFVGKKKAQFIMENRKGDPMPEAEGYIERNICPICKEKMRPQRSRGKGIRTLFTDDLPLNQLIKYDQYTYIDREIAAYLRLQDKST